MSPVGPVTATVNRRAGRLRLERVVVAGTVGQSS
jgi:hypothetical protein